MSRVDRTHPLSRSFSAPTDPPPEGLLTVAEAAKAAGLTIAQIWARINTGKLQAHRITREPLPPPPPRRKRGPRPSVFINLKDLEKLIEPAATENEVAP
jgi:hypothetical protein